jgi:hypothetical protein
VDIRALQRALDDVFDQALVFHAFTPYMRDYELIVHATADPRTGIQPAHLRYLFKYCVEASTESTVADDTWRVSLDERLIEYSAGVELDGFVWGVNWQPLHPGMTVVPGSPRAQRWSERLGLDFHEVRIESNAHVITLVFSELVVTELPLGWSPFVVTADDVEQQG